MIQAAFRRHAPSFDDLPINRPEFRRAAAEFLEASERLQGYRDYLALARDAKASGRAPEVDRAMLGHSPQVRSDHRSAGSASTRSALELHRSGAATRIGNCLADALRVSGTTTACDIWRSFKNSPCARGSLDRAGAPKLVLQALEKIVPRLDISLHVAGKAIVAEGTLDGQRIGARMETAPRAAAPADLRSLLARGRFERVATLVARGEPAYLLGAGAPDGDPRLADLMLSDILAAQREGIRHLRKLEDAGLATHSGGEPATIALIGLAILIIGALILIAECRGNEPDDPDASEACVAGMLLSGLGIALLLIGGGPDPGLNTNGSLVQGPLLGLETA